MILGWLDGLYQWQLPLHQEVEGNDFLFEGWCGACGWCLDHQAPTICSVCSYDTKTGHAGSPVRWPCKAVSTCRNESGPRVTLALDNDGKYHPRSKIGLHSSKRKPSDKKQ